MNIILFTGIIVAVSCYLLYITTTFPRPHALEGELFADFWPRILLVGLLATSSFLTIGSIIARIKGPHEKLGQDEERSVTNKQTSMGKLISAIVMTLSYVYLLEIFGIAVLTPIFLFFFLYNMGLRKKTLLASVPFILTAATIVTFTQLMFVMLPRGRWIFRDISILFY